MAFRRYYPTKDTFVANVDPGVLGYPDISDSNMGASEILNMFLCNDPAAVAKIYIQFPQLSTPSGSEVWFKLFNAQHSQAQPYSYNCLIRPMEQEWSEGLGQDLDYYTDQGVASYNSATLTTATAAMTGTASASFFFDSGHEDMEVDITSLSMSNGLAILIDPSYTGSNLYVKKFHSRHSHFPNKRPYAEVRWDDSTGSLSTYAAFHVTGSGPWSGSYLEDTRLTATMNGEIVYLTSSLVDPTGTLDMRIYNIKSTYFSNENIKLRVSIRSHDYQQNSYAEVKDAVLTDAYYSVIDDHTGEIVVPFGTGSLKYTKLSYDDRGNYFSLSLSNFIAGPVYRIDIGYNIGDEWLVIRGNDSKFRVRDR